MYVCFYHTASLAWNKQHKSYRLPGYDAAYVQTETATQKLNAVILRKNYYKWLTNILTAFWSHPLQWKHNTSAASAKVCRNSKVSWMKQTCHACSDMFNKPVITSDHSLHPNVQHHSVSSVS